MSGNHFSRKLTSLLIAAAFSAPLLATGCAQHRRVYYYDPAQENSYYVQWEAQTHRHHEDFNKRSKSDQKAYWDWRHKNDHTNHKDHDHDNNPH